MNSYHVYFSVKDSVSPAELESILSQFIAHEKKHNLMLSARVLRMTNKASFPELTDYHFIADYATDADGKSAMENMKKRYKDEPHSSLMRIVSEFRVAFSEELICNAWRQPEHGSH